jgi:hypothetical protein
MKKIELFIFKNCLNLLDWDLIPFLGFKLLVGYFATLILVDIILMFFADNDKCNRCMVGRWRDYLALGKNCNFLFFK